MDAPSDSPVGRYGGHWRWMGVFYLGLAGLQALLALVFGHPSLGLPVVWAVLGCSWFLVSVTSIKATGVRVNRRRFIPWTDVEAVLVPAPWSEPQEPTIRLVGGELVRLRHVPAQRGAAVSALAGLNAPILQPPMARTVAVAVDRPLSDAELGRRFAAVEARGRSLSNGIRPKAT